MPGTKLPMTIITLRVETPYIINEGNERSVNSFHDGGRNAGEETSVYRLACALETGLHVSFTEGLCVLCNLCF